MSYSAGRVSQAYASVGTQTQVDAASPHRLIQLLMDVIVCHYYIHCPVAF